MIIDHFCREKERDKERRSMDRMGEDGSKRDIRKKDILLYNTFRTFFKFKLFLPHVEYYIYKKRILTLRDAFLFISFLLLVLLIIIVVVVITTIFLLC